MTTFLILWWYYRVLNYRGISQTLVVAVIWCLENILQITSKLGFASCVWILKDIVFECWKIFRNRKRIKKLSLSLPHKKVASGEIMQLPDPVAHYRAVFGSILKKTFSIWAQKVTFKLNFGGGFGSWILYQLPVGQKKNIWFQIF